MKLVKANAKYLRFLELSVSIFGTSAWFQSDTSFSSVFSTVTSTMSDSGQYISEDEISQFYSYPADIQELVSRWNKTYSNWGKKLIEKIH